MSTGAHPETRFAADWLALREPADAAAHASELTALAERWLVLRARRPLSCVDLGSGSGSNLRFLAPRLPGPQAWRLLDHDAELLARALHGCHTLQDADGRPAGVSAEQRDLGRLAETDVEGADLVCASALIDILGVDALERIAAAAVHAGAAVLFTLSVDGQWWFRRGAAEDIDPDDACARAAFNAHQRRDKGVGGALGPDAQAWLVARLRALGYHVREARSPWQLRMDRPGDAALACALLDGWLHAALEQTPAQAPRLRDWHARRLAAIARPDATIGVGHRDLFACPVAGAGHPA